MKKAGMINLIPFMLILLFPLTTFSKDSHVEFYSIDYPGEIILASKDFEKELRKKKLIIKYKYLGKDFMSDICIMRVPL